MKKKKLRKRNGDILAHLRGDINISTRTIRSKKLYNRKRKHKNKVD